MPRSRESYIRRRSRRYGLDPNATIAVALGEGGLVNRRDDIGDQAGGGSYGPFQLYAQGALPARYRGNPEAADRWAWSDAGIDYALSQMQQAGAGGKRGRGAVETIIRKFERPADPDKSVAAALARLGSGPALGSGAEGGAPSGFRAPDAAPEPSAGPDPRHAFALELATGQRSGSGRLREGLLDLATALRNQPERGPGDVDTAAPTPEYQEQGTPARVRQRQGGGITYSGQKSTHPTAGLEGYPAVDLFAKPGTPFTAPEDGEIIRHSGKGGTSGNVYGRSVYYRGDSGKVYFVTHLGAVAPKGRYRRGQQLGTVSAWEGGAPHAHVGVRR